HELLERRDVGLIEAKLYKIERHAGPVQDAQDHAFAERGGNRRDTQVDVDAAHGDLDAPVLGQPPLRDVEPRHDLEPRGDNRAQLDLERLNGAQEAIDAIAHENGIHSRLDVNIRGAYLDGMGDDVVDEADGGRLACQVAQALDIEVAGIECGSAAVRAVSRLAIETLICPLELCRSKQTRAHGHAGQISYGTPWLIIEGIGDADEEVVGFERQRHDTHSAHEVGCDLVDENRLPRHIA